VLIGLLLALVAFVLGRDVGALIIGESAEPSLVVDAYDRLAGRPEVSQVVELLTMHLGPAEVLVAVRLDLDDGLTGAQVEAFSNEADRDLRATHPRITQVFLDATRPDPELAARTAVHVERLRATVARRPGGEPGQPLRPERDTPSMM
jgi:divalent metal cation (Fe/Co/Zn/Cd) transporter